MGGVLLQWAGHLRWLPGQGHVIFVEMALDFEAHTERALPAPSDHQLQGVTLPLGIRRPVPYMAVDALHLHLQVRDILQGKEVWMAKSVLPVGGLRFVGRAACPLFSHHVVPNAAVGGTLPRSMDAAPSAAGSEVAGCAHIGLPTPTRTSHAGGCSTMGRG